MNAKKMNGRFGGTVVKVKFELEFYIEDGVVQAWNNRA